MAICDKIAKDMEERQDATQYGNRKRTGTQHYLVRLINKILSETKKNKKGGKGSAVHIY